RPHPARPEGLRGAQAPLPALRPAARLPLACLSYGQAAPDAAISASRLPCWLGLPSSYVPTPPQPSPRTRIQKPSPPAGVPLATTLVAGSSFARHASTDAVKSPPPLRSDR